MRYLCRGAQALSMYWYTCVQLLAFTSTLLACVCCSQASREPSRSEGGAGSNDQGSQGCSPACQLVHSHSTACRMRPGGCGHFFTYICCIYSKAICIAAIAANASCQHTMQLVVCSASALLALLSVLQWLLITAFRRLLLLVPTTT